MFGGISYIGWFHTILGIAAIVAGLYLLIRDRFIFMDSKLAKFLFVKHSYNMRIILSFIWGNWFI